MYNLIFDPGHGGRDPGALGAATKEKDNNLLLARKAADMLNRSGLFKVRLTREKDEDFCGTYFNVEEDLKNRVDDANAWGGDVFVSFHNNSAAVKTAFGNEVYAWMPGGEAEKLARKVNARMTAQLGMTDRGVKYAAFYVCRKTDMPAILIEYGFINNEESLILANMDNAALAIAQGIGDYFNIRLEEDEDMLEKAILLYSDEDYWAGKDVSLAGGGIGIFTRSTDKKVIPPEVVKARQVIVIGGASIGHRNEVILSGLDKYDTARMVKEYLERNK